MTDEASSLIQCVDAIFFDCDGVILHSVHVKERQFRAMMEERIPHVANAAMDYYWRNGGTSRLAKFRWIWANLVGRPLTDADVERLGQELRQRVFDSVASCPMIPGAEAFLEAFGGSIPCFLISGTPKEELNAVVEARGLRRFFRAVEGSPESKTEIGSRLIHVHSLAPDRVWFVGDATTDLEAARNLGVHFVGVAGPHLSPFATGDEVLIDDLTELEAAILQRR